MKSCPAVCPSLIRLLCSWALALCLAPVAVFAEPGDASGELGTVNIYRYILSSDVPESPATVTLGLSTTHVLLGSSPKPVSATLLNPFGGEGGAVEGVAIDVVPYFLVGGGERDLDGFRSNSVAGRLSRVGTKTQMSFGAARSRMHDDALDVAFSVRATFHDPHDPALNSTLPEDMARRLADHGAPSPSPDDEDPTDEGEDLQDLFAAKRNEMRKRGGILVSGGWGVSGTMHGAVVEKDSVRSVRHHVFLAGQIILGSRFDLLTSAQYRNAFRSDDFVWIGAGLLRKLHAVNLTFELYYDSSNKRLNPGMSAQGRVLPRLEVIAGLTTQSPGSGGDPELHLRTQLRWFFAHDG